MKKKLVHILILVSGLILGVLIGVANFHFSLSGVFLLISISLSALICLVASLFLRFYKVLEFSLSIFISCLLCFFVMKVSYQLLDNKRTNKAELIISEIKNFKITNGKLPRDLNKIKVKDSLPNLFYQPDKELENFSLSYSINGWSFKEFNSKNDKWIIKD